ncbi:MAG TPA: hypothetical protein VLA15_02575 [Desulfurivibrionaceae bacterium]|nr:hypothetical protein [Desulfurivibrionaceae bacterium]
MAISRFDQHAMAATFAEAGEHETAKELLKGSGAKQRQPQPQKHAQAKKPYLSTVVLGTASLASIFYLFSNEALVTDVFTRGGVYAIWPLATVMFFSFIHGAFGSNLLTVLGLEAKKK